MQQGANTAPCSFVLRKGIGSGKAGGWQLTGDGFPAQLL